MGKKRNVPEIRFAGFTDDWEQRKLGEIATFSKGQGYSKSDLISSGFPIILYGQLYTNYQTSISDVTTFVNNDEDAIKSIGNEVIVPASGETAEDIARATAIEKQGIIIGGDLNIVRPNKKVRPFFLALTLSNGNPKNSIAKKAQGKSIVHIRNDDLKEIQIIFPNTEEQTAIGNFFKQLDETIALHQREYEKYKNLKISYLEKMFPKENEQFPELRFSEFTDAWEQRKLGDLVQIKTGKLDANAMVEGGKYDFYTSGIKKYKIDVAAFEGPAITIAGNGATVGYMHYADGLFNAYQRTYVLSDLNLNRSFLYQEINKKLQKKIKQEVRAGNIPYIVLEMLTELNINYPSEKEQTAIGNFFKQLDETIALHQRELEKYKKIKQSYLEKMFV